MARIRQSEPDAGVVFQVKVVAAFSNVPSFIGRATFIEGAKTLVSLNSRLESHKEEEEGPS